MKTSHSVCGLVSHYNERVTVVAAKLSTYQITQEGEVSLFPNRGPPSYFSKDWIFIKRTKDVADFSPYRNILIEIHSGCRVCICFCQTLFGSSYFIDIFLMLDKSLS